MPGHGISTNIQRSERLPSQPSFSFGPRDDPFDLLLPAAGLGGLFGGIPGAIALGAGSTLLPQRTRDSSSLQPALASADPSKSVVPSTVNEDGSFNLRQALLNADIDPALVDLFVGQEEQSQALEQGAVDTARGGIGDALTRLQDFENIRAAEIKEAFSILQASFDPALSQFQSLFDNAAISDAQRTAGLSRIQGQSAADRRDAIRASDQQFAARGLTGSASAASGAAEASNKAARTRAGSSIDFTTAVDQINADIRVRAAAGFGNLTGQRATLGATGEAALTQLGEFEQGLGSQLAGIDANILTGQNFSPPDITGLIGLQESRDFNEFTREQAIQAIADANNVPLQLIQSLGDDVIGFLFSLITDGSFFSGVR